jgi:hypothetical protein
MFVCECFFLFVFQTFELNLKQTSVIRLLRGQSLSVFHFSSFKISACLHFGPSQFMRYLIIVSIFCSVGKDSMVLCFSCRSCQSNHNCLVCICTLFYAEWCWNEKCKNVWGSSLCNKVQMILKGLCLFLDHFPIFQSQASMNTNRPFKIVILSLVFICSCCYRNVPELSN